MDLFEDKTNSDYILFKIIVYKQYIKDTLSLNSTKLIIAIILNFILK